MPTPPGNADSFANLFEQSSDARRGRREYRVGEQVEVTIVAIARDAVFADLGGKQEGVFRAHRPLRRGRQAADRGRQARLGRRRLDRQSHRAGPAQPVVIRGADADIGVARASSSGPAGSTGPVLVEGARIKGKITGLERYGIFVQIEGTFGRSGRGLVPSQETGTSRGADLKSTSPSARRSTPRSSPSTRPGRSASRSPPSAPTTSAGSSRPSSPAKGGGARRRCERERGSQRGAEGRARKDKKPEPRNFGTLADLLSKTTVKAAPAPRPGPRPRLRRPRSPPPTRRAAGRAQALSFSSSAQMPVEP